jgi:O-antigen/teichoic acid export membrane protein
VLFQAVSRGRPLAFNVRIVNSWRTIRRAVGRLSWGVADQATSSLTNFAVNLFIARELGAVSYGAFSIAYVTYSFALNASRGLATDPLLVRFSGADRQIWRRSVASCTGTAAVVGVVTGIAALAMAIALHGTLREAFIALGLTLPGLLLQDSWRFCFFAAGRGVHALLNDGIWAAVLIPALLLLKMTHHVSVFWFLLAWGLSATVAALVGPLQARVIPRPSVTLQWVRAHRDLGPRYLLEGVANSGSTQLRNYGVAAILGLAAVGYVQGASTLMGPFMVIFFGMGLVTLPEAARILRRSPRHLPLFCVLVSAGLSLLAIAWGTALLVAMPRGLGYLMLGSIWRPTYPLVFPLLLSVIGGCISAGAGCGLHALGVAKRSLRAMVQSSLLYVALGIAGAYFGGAKGAMDGAAVSGLIGGAVFWWQLKVALSERKKAEAAAGDLSGHGLELPSDVAAEG